MSDDQPADQQFEDNQDPAEYESPEGFEDDLAQRNRVFELDNEDFALKATDGLTLYGKGCSLVLFYGKGSLSKKLLILWHQAADEYSGVNFFTVNTNLRRDIMRRFTDIKLSPNHIMNRFTKRPIPFILVYRESNEPNISYPQAFYDGTLSEDTYETGELSDSFYDWVTNMACEADYHGTVATDESGYDLPDETRRVSGDYKPPSRTVVERVIKSREDEIDRLQIEPETDLEEQRAPPEDILPVVHQTSAAHIGYVRF